MKLELELFETLEIKSNIDKIKIFIGATGDIHVEK